MRRKAITWMMRAIDWLRPKPDLRPEVESLTRIAGELLQRQQNEEKASRFMDSLSDIIEARQMAGAGPWSVSPELIRQTDGFLQVATECAHRLREGASMANLRETIPPISAGAFGDIELALQNVSWQREVNFTWMEFSRWGIQQIILMCRLYYIKHPVMRRLIDVCAAYVFARGVEISSPDESLNKDIERFLKANQKTLGQRALVKSEKRRDYDGNIFWVFFDDLKDTGESTVRIIDATEISEIETDPDDTDTPWYYHRICSQRVFNPENGQAEIKTVRTWYPALGYEPDSMPDMIRGDKVEKDHPVYHSKSGDVAKWNFGCPRAYPALDWAREGRRILEACASVKQSNAQIAREITTKGGQQAIEGIKSQLQTTVGPSAQIWDTNPPAVAGASWVSGTGTQMKLVQQRGMSDSPDEVRRYWQMCVMVFGVPLTFLGDTMDGSMATAQSLDRPTETVMLEKQEQWREDLMMIVTHGIEVSKNAPRGKLRESLRARGLEPSKVNIRECSRVPSKDGTRMKYASLQRKDMRLYEAGAVVPDEDLLVRVNFPAIREGDLKLLVDATVQAMTLGNRAGQVIGIDEKAGVQKLYDELEFEDGDELCEEQYPDGEYERDRTKEILPPPIAKPPAGLPGGQPIAQEEQPGDVKEAVARLNRAVAVVENGRNGKGGDAN